MNNNLNEQSPLDFTMFQHNSAKKNTPFESKSDSLSSKHELHILKFGKLKSSSKKNIQVSKLVTVKEGGELVLKYQDLQNNNIELHVEINLKVKPGAINKDAELTLSIDKQQLCGNFDLTFGPHGITFNEPAILDILAVGLNLTGVKQNTISIYYDNPETGQWEEMPHKGIQVLCCERFVRVVGAEIPHFSRYALAVD